MSGGGAGDVFNALAARKLSALTMTFWTYAFSVVIFVPYAVGHWTLVSRADEMTVAEMLVLSLALLIGSLAFNAALAAGNPTVVGTITACFVSVSVVLSLVFLHEQLTTMQAVAVLLTFVGVVVCSLEVSQIRQRGAWLNRGMVLALVAMLGWGTYFAFVKIPTEVVGWFWPAYVTYVTIAVVVGVGGWFRLGRAERPIAGLRWRRASGFPALLVAAILTSSANFAFNQGVAIGATSVVAPVAGSYPTLYVALTAMVFRQPLTRQQWLGIGLVLVGIVVLAVG